MLSPDGFRDPLPPVQIIDANGELAPSDSWFPDAEADLPEKPIKVIAITGPQASGKSTLLNLLFSTQFPVASRDAVGESTTRGIFASLCSTEEPLVVLDVEGADARARGRGAKIFASQCASFVSALADVVIVNLWFHDACRLDSMAYAMLRSILTTCGKAFVDGVEARVALVVAVRDAEGDPMAGSPSLRDMVMFDVSIFHFIIVHPSRGRPTIPFSIYTFG